MVLVSVSIHEARISSNFSAVWKPLEGENYWKKLIISENIKSNELSLK